MSDYTTGDDCIWPHCSTIATCPCCRKDAEIERLRAQYEDVIKSVWRALDILQNDKFATRAYNAATELKDILDTHGYPDDG